MRHCRLHHIVTAARAHVPGDLAVAAEDGQIDDRIHARSCLHNAIQVGCVQVDKLAGQLFLRRLDVGDAQGVGGCKFARHIGAKHPCSAKNEYVHFAISPNMFDRPTRVVWPGGMAAGQRLIHLVNDRHRGRLSQTKDPHTNLAFAGELAADLFGPDAC